jgi:outer membrane cobalamin receptor
MSNRTDMTGRSGLPGQNAGVASTSHLFRLMILCGSLTATVVAYAQAAGNNAAAASDELTEVVVTGSRLIKNGNDSPTPVTVLSVEDAEAVHPGTVADQLNDMPQFFGSNNQASNAGAGNLGTGGNPNPNANVLNLRNFGTNRTLILWDGHRASATAPNGTVDIDMIPQLLLQRVEVVTGGASAVYGADAVTGVVNFITDTKFNGIKVNGQAGRSVYQDDETKDGPLQRARASGRQFRISRRCRRSASLQPALLPGSLRGARGQCRYGGPAALPDRSQRFPP